MSKSFKKIPTNMREHLSELSGNELKVWLYFYLRTGSENTAFPSNETVAKDTDLNLDTVKTCKKNLRAKGWLSVYKEQGRDGGGNFGTVVEKTHLPWLKNSTTTVVENTDDGKFHHKVDTFPTEVTAPLKASPIHAEVFRAQTRTDEVSKKDSQYPAGAGRSSGGFEFDFDSSDEEEGTGSVTSADAKQQISPLTEKEKKVSAARARAKAILDSPKTRDKYSDLAERWLTYLAPNYQFASEQDYIDATRVSLAFELLVPKGEDMLIGNFIAWMKSHKRGGLLCRTIAQLAWACESESSNNIVTQFFDHGEICYGVEECNDKKKAFFEAYLYQMKELGKEHFAPQQAQGAAAND